MMAGLCELELTKSCTFAGKYPPEVKFLRGTHLRLEMEWMRRKQGEDEEGGRRTRKIC